ncbi:MAG: DUF4364 family protein [Christensenellales bacterium]
MRNNSNWLNNPVFVPDNTINKLIFLFVLDKMEIPLTEDSIIDICTSRNEWLKYMDCKDVMWQLLDVGYIAKTANEDVPRYNITNEGRNCLSNFYLKIPSSTREEITVFAKENRMVFKRAQEYTGTYYKNSDGSYTTALKIKDPLQSQNLFELKIVLQSRKSAVNATKKWREKAPSIYESVYEILCDDDTNN